MCTDTHEYNEFPARTIGGPSGDYEIMCDVTDAEWVEYRIVSACGGEAGPWTITVSGSTKNPPILFTGTQSFGLSSQSQIGVPIIDGVVIHSTGISTVPMQGIWKRVANQQRKIFARVDIPTNNSAFVTIQFRDKILKKIPQPFVTVHPEEMEQYHQERERRIQEAVFGEEGELEVYGHKGQAGGTREVTGAGSPIVNGQGKFKRK